jgi:hypothetical protein
MEDMKDALRHRIDVAEHQLRLFRSYFTYVK